jgi:hypothetical protein
MKLRLIVSTAVLLFASVVTAQESIEACKTNRNSPPAGRTAWLPDSEVKVYFSQGAFTPDQRTALLNAMTLWTQMARRSDAGVTFTYAGDTGGMPSCNNCLVVTRQNVRKYFKYFAYFTPVQRGQNGQMMSAWIVFDNATVDPQALQVFMTHELGHGMGLDNCPSCKQTATIMRSFPRINQVDRLIEPSACDLKVVRQVYEHKRQVGSSVVASRG